ncbi:hypothetical protein CDAR_577851 [Caerostris darwini]|uniref:Uncharacterized protein n=1 Tax=Caerostris darwini TaxID=1538125 RepID=A0AAV4RI11_9ARAC|nr:hypothetical protein CDAR_577851 [Caerostris darwini]
MVCYEEDEYTSREGGGSQTVAESRVVRLPVAANPRVAGSEREYRGASNEHSLVAAKSSHQDKHVPTFISIAGCVREGRDTAIPLTPLASLHFIPGGLRKTVAESRGGEVAVAANSKCGRK